MTARFVIGAAVLFGGLALMLGSTVPRLLNDYRHAGEFVPAQNLKLTDYKCTNWNIAMFDKCVVTFASTQNQASGQLTDWRFGRAPRDPVHLLQRRDDPSSVTTDVSLRTLWNRLAMAATFVMTGVLLAFGLVLKAAKLT